MVEKKYIQTKKIPKRLLSGVLVFIAVSGHMCGWGRGRNRDGGHSMGIFTPADKKHCVHILRVCRGVRR